MNRLEINRQVISIVDKNDWDLLLKKIKDILKIKKDWELSAAIVSPQKIKALNLRYRRKNSVTDVLSFANDNSEEGDLGEVIICWQRAKQQAKAQKHSIQKELNTLFVHGVLHLLGFDHESVKDAQLMEGLEAKILNQ
jgi:probable rRNA maturation factor